MVHSRTKLRTGHSHCGWGQHMVEGNTSPCPGRLQSRTPLSSDHSFRKSFVALHKHFKGSEHAAAAQARKSCWCWVTFSLPGPWSSGVRPPALLISPSREGLTRTHPVALYWDLTGVCHGENLCYRVACRGLLPPHSSLQIHSVWKATPRSTQALNKMPPASCSSM